MAEGADGVQSTNVVNVVDDGKWLRVNASGFHYSKLNIKVQLTSSTSESSAPSAAVSTSTRTAVTTELKIQKTLTLKISKVTSDKLIASFAKIKVLSTSKVSLRVLPSSAKFCRVSGASLKGLKAGSCKVTVTVRPKKGKAVSKTITLKVTK